MTAIAQENRKEQPQVKAASKKRGWIARIFGALVFSLVVSILLEWVGMYFFWPELGAAHSRNMVAYELAYLNEDFRRGLFESSPATLISHYAGSAYYYLFEWTMLADVIQWLGTQVGLVEYAEAALNTTQVLMIRVGILTFSLPLYLLFAIVGASSGLSMRDIRRWSGGREYGRVYHKAKALAPKMLVVAWVIYLTWPESIHPNLIIFPCAVLFGLNILIVTASFKKYL